MKLKFLNRSNFKPQILSIVIITFFFFLGNSYDYYNFQNSLISFSSIQLLISNTRNYEIDLEKRKKKKKKKKKKKYLITPTATELSWGYSSLMS